MVLITSVEEYQGRIQTQNTSIPLKVVVGTYESESAVKIYGIGSTERKTSPKPSQVFVFKKEQARILIDTLKKTFNL